MVVTSKFFIKTKGRNDIQDITDKVQSILSESGVKEGNILCFVSGSTASLTTIEYEPGLLKDLPEALENIAPMNKIYHHDDTWHDGNGYAHVRASLIGPSLTIPFSKGKLLLGTWQQIILIDFDNRSRERAVIVQIMGE
ncbi:MAG TPA: secondary thiamine-phosphate synthase enzyme YjbQ [Bacteroidota bacterium]|jgi:secondary thiamine-phosphate synthase enzyme|nr:secondary thiamine-phosphate synthase enzyme YjbQ [Bacteroidota bacterium]